ncbi:hypothetical protein [Zongyangia hominis]|uniref:Uncharacterized protein n=1 Tax=Zongyangia hominis TaxID=2763677 RepID=A0A926EF33_9FIRM|nr:hypothetical protein [Zongyangia hominis]MBC8570537.1 hypothetical protein [Zongyangia hominis]
MEIRKEYRWFLDHYGSRIKLGEDSFKAVLLPANRTTMGRREKGDYIPAGQEPREEYIYIGPVEHPLPVDAVVECGGQEFVVRSSMEVLFEDAPLYNRAILMPAEDKPWQ